MFDILVNLQGMESINLVQFKMGKNWVNVQFMGPELYKAIEGTI